MTQSDLLKISKSLKKFGYELQQIRPHSLNEQRMENVMNNLKKIGIMLRGKFIDHRVPKNDNNRFNANAWKS